MKNFPYLLAALLVTATLCLRAGAAENNPDILDRFENALLDVMANFEVAHDASSLTADNRKLYDKSFSELQSAAAALQNAVDTLGIGADVNPDRHVKQVNDAFHSMNAKSMLSLTSSTKSTSKNDSANSNDKLRNIGTVSGANSVANRAGIAFRNLNNDLQCLRELDFHSENGRYLINPRKKQLLPYLEFERDYMYFRMNYPDMIDLCNDRAWVSDMEKRLIRMRSLASNIQPVFRAYCPEEAAKVNLAAEAERLLKVCQTVASKAARTAQSNTLGMSTILDNSKIGAKTAPTLNLKSSSVSDSLKNLNKDKQSTTAAVDDASEEYKKNAEKAFSNLLIYFESMDKIDWDVYAFSAKKAKKNPDPSAIPDAKASKKSPAGSAPSAKKNPNPDVVEITGDDDMHWH